MGEEKKNTQLQEKETSMSVRFMNKVVVEFSNGVGEIALTSFQKRLAQNYFVAIDGALKLAEEKRQKKTKNKDPLPVMWANVNMESLSRNVVAAARIGLDPAQSNHINVMPFKNNTLNKYDIVFIEGYRGIELKSTKYGLEVPDDVTVALVYSTDRFVPIKKDRNNQIESYELEITNPFDRGEIIGGFYYHYYKIRPEKNRLVVFTLKDIEKRKPQYASAEFWGGEKTIWKDGKPAGKETVEGWHEKMCWKTLYRAAYKDITIDSQKIDDDYMRLKQVEESYAEMEVAEEIEKNANGEILDIEYEEAPDEAPETEKELQPEKEPVEAQKQAAATKAGQQEMGGPDF